MTKYANRGLIAIVSMIMLLPVTEIFAQSVIEEITVTARQREESLRDVPGTLTVLTADQIERSGVQRAADFINLTPGVTIVDTAEVGDTQVSIRGLNGARDAETSFGLIIDGIVMTNPAALNNKNGAKIAWLTTIKVLGRLIFGRMFCKKQVIDDWEREQAENHS